MPPLEKKTKDDPLICPECGVLCDVEDDACEECGTRLRTQEVDGFKKGIC